MLADRTLVQISPASRKVLVRISLGPRNPIAGPGRFLALSGDGRRLFALTPSGPGKAQEVRIFDPARLRLLKRFSLERGIVFRVIALGRQSSRIYLFGNRPQEGRAEDAVVAILGADGQELRTSSARKAAGHDWWVYDGAVSHDESRLYVSYHGGCSANTKLCTSGADWIDVAGDRLVRCERRTLPGNGCLLRVHGGVEAFDGAVLATTGGGPILQISSQGEIVAARRTRLPGNHLMEFALDGRHERAYAVGQCYYTGAVSVIDLSTGRSRVLNRDVCGERIAVGDDLLAVAEAQQATPLGIPSRVALVDPSTGSARYANVPVEALDLIVVPKG